MYVKEIIIIMGVVIIGLIIFFRRNISDIGNPIDELRDNNQQSKDINRQTVDIIDKLESENIEITGLNSDIRTDNRTASDIIKSIRKQKLDW